TDIATGVAMLMGFYLPLNFNSPYKAPNPGNFWKRWHVSLSQWLQHYLYIPLGGNREASFGTYCCIITIACIGALLSGSIWVAVIVAIVTVTISVVAVVKPDTRKKINTNLNRMNTMLLGGLWHGASWNFMIWGGLNGLGMVVYEFWKKWDVYVRTLAIMLVTLLFLFLDYRYELPAYRIGLVWTSALFLGTFIRMLYNLFDGKKAHAKLEHVWAIAQTFVFITFTRLFFRSGSNLDPAEANKVAWNTTKTMVEQMATAWNSATIIDMLVAYRFVFGLIVTGLIIHWLPDHLKRWYRLNFALLPLPVMAIAVVAVVFIVYQFMTADLQAFIYFQF
ncbi:MAG: MBOAT family protein, partial [Paludibacteraceae bacterium]|nr:MBOAT family protein [Paludibacteraceae bacterium]